MPEVRKTRKAGAEQDLEMILGAVNGQRLPMKAEQRQGRDWRGQQIVELKEEKVQDLSALDIELIATALADQTDGEYQWLFDPTTGELVTWTSDTGIDGHNPIELEDLDPNLMAIDPIPSYIWYQDMVEFADGISDEATGERLPRTLQGRGAFGRFKNLIYQHPELISPWQTLGDTRARPRAVGWLLDQELIAPGVAEAYLDGHPDPEIP